MPNISKKYSNSKLKKVIKNKKYNRKKQKFKSKQEDKAKRSHNQQNYCKIWTKARIKEYLKPTLTIRVCK